MTQILTSLHGRLLGLSAKGELVCPAGIVIGDPAHPESQARIPLPSERIKDAGSVTLTMEDDGKTQHALAPWPYKLPRANGTGLRLRIVVHSSVSGSVSVSPQSDDGDVMEGIALLVGAAGAVSGFAAGPGTNTITLNGTTTGGLGGDVIDLQDVQPGIWAVSVTASASGTAATPFSTV